MSHARWRRLTVVGPGLIGGSVARGARARRLADEVVVVGRSATALREVVVAGGADRATEDLAKGVRDAAMVVLCTPVGTLPGFVRAAWPHLGPGTVLTDAGSVKREVVEAAAACAPRPGVAFAGGHPMAGSERSGFAASDPDLFQDRLALVIETPGTPATAIAEVSALWEGLGSQVRRIGVEAHDRGVALISHLPHLAAYGLVLTADEEALELAARGFIDTTRVAASAEALWADIFRGNRRLLLLALARYQTVLARWETLIRTGDFTGLEVELGRARGIREKLG